MKAKLGKVYRDKVTGFVGTATGKHEYLNGCVQFTLEARVKDEGTKPEAIAVDEQQLEEVKERKAAERTPARTGGGVRHRP